MWGITAVWRGGWPQLVMCPEVNHRPASQNIRWVTTRFFGDKPSSHTQTCCSNKPFTLPPQQITITKISNGPLVVDASKTNKK